MTFCPSVKSYRRGLRNGALVNPKLFILEKVNLGPHTKCWSNLVKHVKNSYYLVRVVTIPVICFYNRKTTMIEIDVKYVRNKVDIVPLDVSIDFTYDQLLVMIYSRTIIDKKEFKLLLTCKYPLKSRNRF